MALLILTSQISVVVAEGAFLFVSLSMPKPLLLSMAEEASRYKIPLIIKGLENGNFNQTLQTIYHLKLNGVSINPLWFEQFKITAVPALVVTENENFDVVYGNQSIQKSLQLIAERGNAASSLANDYLNDKAYIKSLGNQPLSAAQQFNPADTFKNYNPNPNPEEFDPLNLDFMAKRSSVTINKEDIQRGQSIEENSNNITHSMGNVFCVDGECTEKESSKNDHFTQSVSELAAASGIGAQAQGSTASLFAGHAYSCEMSSIHFIDCCSNKGWGKKLHLANCNPQDRELGIAKQQYRVHFLGAFCYKKWKWPLHGCQTKKNTYCVFDSKLARILQVEGRLVQGINSQSLGSAESPYCAGFSVDEMQRLDLSRIDFINPIYPYPSNEHVHEAGIAADINPSFPDSLR